MAAEMISVIIPAYNRAKTIGYCLDSIVKQTYQNIEIIVVDDASSDNTVEIVNDFPDERVRCIQLTKNSGAQVARNTGIENANGEWIAFQDSDDEWLPNKLAIQIEQVYNTKTDMNYCECYVKSNGEIKLFGTKGYTEQVYEKLLIEPDPTFPGILVRKECLHEIGMLDVNVPAYQEWDTSIRLAKICKISYCSTPLFIYHLHEGETISKDTKRGLKGMEYIINKHSSAIEHYAGDLVLHYYYSIIVDQYNKLGELNHELINKLKKLNIKMQEKLSSSQKNCIFGASVTGAQCLEQLTEHKKSLFCFIDNYYTTDSFVGFPVYKTAHLSELNPDVIILASQGNMLSMQRELMKFGMIHRSISHRVFESI